MPDNRVRALLRHARTPLPDDRPDEDQGAGVGRGTCARSGEIGSPQPIAHQSAGQARARTSPSLDGVPAFRRRFQ